MNLSNEEKNILIETAKKSIRSEFEDVEIVQPDFEKYPDLKKIYFSKPERVKILDKMEEFQSGLLH